jgi:hypothetical protein
MVKPVATDKFAEKTGRTMKEWIAWLDEAGARTSSHTDIAAKLVAVGVPGWWAQSVTVAYEQQTGKRVPGQKSDGTFSASVSRMLDGSPADVRARLERALPPRADIAGRKPEAAATTSDTPTALNWRIRLEDGSRAIVSCAAKGEGRTNIAVEHERLADAAAIAPVKAWWAGLFDRIKETAD